MIGEQLKSGEILNGFSVDRVEAIPELRLSAIICTHVKTGARLIHLNNEDPNNLFCIAFRTPAADDTGVPHILEHSVLAGSRKFPVRDPFKEMLKGSLYTFLNAMTYPDKTIYPVSSQVETDFFNLADVYCDAVFHPLLDKMTFLQEGWHFDAENPESPVGIKGIVYNEMKGVFSDFRSHVARRTLAGLYPDTTYSFDSGGDPLFIPSLTFEQFTAFHKSYYHPSNSYIFIYGNIPTAKTLRFLNDSYLSGFDRCSIDSSIKFQPVWKKPAQMTITAPSSADDDGYASVIVSWIFGNSADPVNGILGQVISRYLLGTETSPLRRALIDSGLGEDLDGMCGYDSDLCQSMFCAGLRRTLPGHANKIEKLVLDTILRETDSGLDSDLLEGSIRQLEFDLREVTDAGHFPYHLSLAERCYRSWMYGGDPLAHLKFDAPLKLIKAEKARGTQYFADVIRKQLLNNTHRLLTVVEASAEMGTSLGKLTERQASEMTSSFTREQVMECVKTTADLLAYQGRQPEPAALASLPRLDRRDLPPQNRLVPTSTAQFKNSNIYMHPLFTGGIGYLDIGFPMENVPIELLRYFPLYSQMISRCGAGNFSVEQMAIRVSLNTGGTGCSELCAFDSTPGRGIVCKAVFHGKALASRFDAMTAILTDLFCAPVFTNTKLVRDILLEMRNDFNAALLNSGHTFAASHAAARLSRSRYVVEQLQGIAQLRFLESLVEDNNTDSIISSLELLHKAIISGTRCFASLTADKPEDFILAVNKCLSCLPQQTVFDASPEIPVPASEALMQGLEISTSVNFVSRVWLLDKPDTFLAGGLIVISKSLSTGYLWEKVRVEGGAYGGKAFSGGTHPVFMCASYRDPNISRTLEHFRKAIELTAGGLPVDDVNQSVIGAIGSIDHPLTPHALGWSETAALVSGRPVALRQNIRDAVLSATPQTLAACARTILESQSCVTVLGSDTAFDKAASEGVELERSKIKTAG